MRKRIKSPIFSAKADGTIIRRGQLDTHQRMVKAIRELGLDPKQYFRDMKWRALCRVNAISLK
jgi:hypothetical protein